MDINLLFKLDINFSPLKIPQSNILFELSNTETEAEGEATEEEVGRGRDREGVRWPGTEVAEECNVWYNNLAN